MTIQGLMDWAQDRGLSGDTDLKIVVMSGVPGVNPGEARPFEITDERGAVVVVLVCFAPPAYAAPPPNPFFTEWLDKAFPREG